MTATFTDNDLSASNGKARPGYVELLALIDSRAVDVVIAWHVDRLTRRLSELEDLITRCETASVRVATVSGDLDLSTDAGRLVGRILGAVARGEIERKSARQRRAALQAAESGRPPSRRAFGFTNGGHDPAEAPALAELYGKVLAGMSMLAATRWLNDRGHRTTTGRRWDRSSTRVMLLNPRNAGLRAHRGEVVAVGTWEPIVTEEVFRAAVEKITDPARRSHSGNARRWLGGGLYRCHCGAKCRINYSHHGQRVYQCSASAHMSRSADPIDELVCAVIAARLRRPDLADLLTPDNRAEVQELRSQAATLRLRLDQVGADYADGLLTGRQLHAATERVTGQLLAAEQALADAGRGSRLAPLLGAADPGQAWLDADLPTRQAVLDTLAVVTVLRGTPGRAPFDPRTVKIEWRGQAT
ncbi:recombinase family protein [soil metagenome]